MSNDSMAIPEPAGDAGGGEWAGYPVTIARRVTSLRAPLPYNVRRPAVVLSNPLLRRTSDAQRDLFDGRLT